MEKQMAVLLKLTSGSCNKAEICMGSYVVHHFKTLFSKCSLVLFNPKWHMERVTCECLLGLKWTLKR